MIGTPLRIRNVRERVLTPEESARWAVSEKTIREIERMERENAVNVHRARSWVLFD